MRTARVARLAVGLAGVAALALVPALTGPSAAASTPVAAHQHSGHSASTGRPSALQVARMRAATATFHNIANAEDAGYGLLHDVAGLTCIAMPGEGGMGVHFVKGPLVADPGLDIRHPEALVYAPDRPVPGAGAPRTRTGATGRAAHPDRGAGPRTAECAPPVCAEGRLGGPYLGQCTCGFHIASTPAGLFFQIQTCCE